MLDTPVVSRVRPCDNSERLKVDSVAALHPFILVGLLFARTIQPLLPNRDYEAPCLWPSSHPSRDFFDSRSADCLRSQAMLDN